MCNQSLAATTQHRAWYPMLAAMRFAAVLGIEAYDVIVDVAVGWPVWTIVRLAGSAVKVALERVPAAFINSGFMLPSRRAMVNSSPVGAIVASGCYGSFTKSRYVRAMVNLTKTAFFRGSTKSSIVRIGRRTGAGPMIPFAYVTLE